MSIETIIKTLTAPEIAGFYDTRFATKPPLIGETIFPATRVVGDQYSFMKGTKGAARLMKLGEYDSNVPLRGRQSFSSVVGDLPLYREGKELNEKDMAELVQVNALGSQALKTKIAEIFNDRADLVLSASVSAERMRMQALAELEVNIASNGTQYKMDYGASADQKQATVIPWSNPEAPILEDIAKAKKTVGSNSVVGYCSQTTFDWIVNNQTIKNAIFASMSSYGIVTPTIARQFLASNFGVTFVVFDDFSNQYIDVDGTTSGQLFPDGVVTFTPVATIGNTVFGTTPEENASLLGLDRNGVETVVLENGISITTTFSVDTVKFQTIVSGVFAPTLQLIDYMFVFDVASGSGATLKSADLSNQPVIGTETGVTLSYNGTPESTPDLTYQWEIATAPSGAFTPITGATSATYTPVVADEGKYIKVVVKATGTATGTVKSGSKKVNAE